jgi:predicted metal-dependent enzyme (double-stranded beta helix superfamily)
MRHAAAVALLAVLAGCRPDLDAALAQTMADSRQAIREHGATDAGLTKIRAALAGLSRVPGLREKAALGELHGSAKTRVGKLASDGDDAISLFIGHFAANTTTPVHDHLTWGVLHVLEGRDVYVPWRRRDAGNDPHRAELDRQPPLTLEPGQSTYWLGPPDDIHSQETKESDVWELVMTGRDVTAEGVTRHRHYFDPRTGKVTGSAPR